MTKKTIFVFLLSMSLTLVRSDNSVCSTCKCDNQTTTVPVLIDCQNANISNLFDSWTFPQNYQDRSGIMYDIDLAKNNLERITNFPKLSVQKISFKTNKIREITPGINETDLEIHTIQELARYPVAVSFKNAT